MATTAAGPAEGAYACTPDNDDLLDPPARALYIGVAGDVKVTMESGGDVTFKNVPVGILPVQATRVFATGTAASEILVLY